MGNYSCHGSKLRKRRNLPPFSTNTKTFWKNSPNRSGEPPSELDALSLSNRTKETNIGNFIADTYRKAANADIGFVNGGSIRADLTYNPGTF